MANDKNKPRNEDRPAKAGVQPPASDVQQKPGSSLQTTDSPGNNRQDKGAAQLSDRLGNMPPLEMPQSGAPKVAASQTTAPPATASSTLKAPPPLPEGPATAKSASNLAAPSTLRQTTTTGTKAAPPPPPRPSAGSADGKTAPPLRQSAASERPSVATAPLIPPAPPTQTAAPPLRKLAALTASSQSPQSQGNAALAFSPPVTPAAEPTADPVQAETLDASNDDDDGRDSRRTARRRPAGPPRDRIAANDDVPSIGGLIYALNQRPSRKPFIYAAAGSGFWLVLALSFAIAFTPGELVFANGISGLLANPWFPTLIATMLGPIALFGFLALLAWRAEELHLRSTAMTEVAVRLAEPDRMAEQSIASLGQAVRRQVSFMNDAVSRALGRAGELEALVHNEVSALEHSYEENERKIRGLINELASERHSLVNTGEHFETSLHKMHVEIPQLMAQLSEQQLKLTSIIESAGLNLTQLETSLASQTGRLENSLGERTTQLESVLGGYTQALGSALSTRARKTWASCLAATPRHWAQRSAPAPPNCRSCSKVNAPPSTRT